MKIRRHYSSVQSQILKSTNEKNNTQKHNFIYKGKQRYNWNNRKQEKIANSWNSKLWQMQQNLIKYIYICKL